MQIDQFYSGEVNPRKIIQIHELHVDFHFHEDLFLKKMSLFVAFRVDAKRRQKAKFFFVAGDIFSV